MEWIQHQLQATGEVDYATRLELREVVERLGAMGADDTRSIEAWKRIRDAVPKVWAATKPVRDVLIGEAVKKALGL